MFTHKVPSGHHGGSLASPSFPGRGRDGTRTPLPSSSPSMLLFPLVTTESSSHTGVNSAHRPAQPAHTACFCTLATHPWKSRYYRNSDVNPSITLHKSKQEGCCTNGIFRVKTTKQSEKRWCDTLSTVCMVLMSHYRAGGFPPAPKQGTTTPVQTDARKHFIAGWCSVDSFSHEHAQPLGEKRPIQAHTILTPRERAGARATPIHAQNVFLQSESGKEAFNLIGGLSHINILLKKN